MRNTFFKKKDVWTRGLPLKCPPHLLHPNISSLKDIETLTKYFTKVIEDSIRQIPSQWTWLNRRWKLPYQKGQKGLLDMGKQEV